MQDPRPVPSIAQVEFGMVIHGGAGTMSRDRMTPELDRDFRAGLDEALRVGHSVLASGGSSLDAVEAAVISLEDDPMFNAGRGSVFAHDGTHSLDASIMDGATGGAGGVAAVPGVKNPVVLARRVMERSPHVLLAGEGALEFARLHDVEIVPDAYFDTEIRREQYERALAGEAVADDQGTPKDTFRSSDASGRSDDVAGDPSARGGEEKFGTVGAVALDQAGRLAAATSTGGMSNKRWGRVGDSPIIGAGTFADDRCAIGGTGWGEYFLRNVVAYDIAARMRYQGLGLAQAAHDAVMVHLDAQASETGGVIGIDRDGHMVWTHNTPGMYRGLVDQDGRRRVAIYREEG